MKNSENHIDNQEMHPVDSLSTGRAAVELALNLLHHAEEDGKNADVSAYVDFWVKRSAAEALVAAKMGEQFVAEYEQEFGRQPKPAEFLGFIKMKMDQIRKMSSAYLQSVDGWESEAGLPDVGNLELDKRGDQSQSEERLLIEEDCPLLIVLIKDRVQRNIFSAANAKALYMLSESTLRELEFCLSEKTLPSAKRMLFRSETGLSEEALGAGVIARVEGRRLGKKSILSEEARLIIIEKSNLGFSEVVIARFLNDLKIATPSGKPVWRTNNVQSAIGTIRVDFEIKLFREVIDSIFVR